MISKETIEELEQDRAGVAVHPGGPDAGAERGQGRGALARAGRYRVVHPKCDESDAPSPLEVKEVWVEGRRYIVCRNQDEARKDAADREAIVASLREKLQAGGEVADRQQGLSPLPEPGRAGSLPDRRGQDRGGGSLRRQVGAADQHGAGCTPRWRCSTSGSGWWRRGSARASRCWRLGRSTTSAMRRSVGHVFCSFLALVLRQELEARLAKRGDDWSGPT